MGAETKTTALADESTIATQFSCLTSTCLSLVLRTVLGAVVASADLVAKRFPELRNEPHLRSYVFCA